MMLADALAQIRAIVAAAAPPVLTDPAGPAPVGLAGAAALPQAPTRVWGDRAAAAALWADCLTLARGVPQGLAYLRRLGAPLPPQPVDRVLGRYKRLRVGVMPRVHIGADGVVHELGWHPCLVAAFGARGARGVLRIWLDEDGRTQSRLTDPEVPARALSPYELVGETAGQAIHLGEMREGLTVAVTLECGLAVLARAPGPVWVVDGLSSAGALDVPQGLSLVYLAAWRVLVAGARDDGRGGRLIVWAPPARRERDIADGAWALSAEGERQLLRLDVAMPTGWSPVPGRPDEALRDERDMARWDDDGGAVCGP